MPCTRRVSSSTLVIHVSAPGHGIKPSLPALRPKAIPINKMSLPSCDFNARASDPCIEAPSPLDVEFRVATAGSRVLVDVEKLRYGEVSVLAGGKLIWRLA
ncbi:hypothetical protein C8Q76DRAFT_247631 [Earliella scabrosa]|nr:hypothetical protein C8Q76DRAFT_247631 [Earliella scabrosa]